MLLRLLIRGGAVIFCLKPTVLQVWYDYDSPIAQLVERVAVNHKVAGSNPAGRVPCEAHSNSTNKVSNI